MANKEVETQETTDGIGEVVEQAMATVSTDSLSASGGGFENTNNEVLAGIAAEIADTLKQISVTEFKGAKTFLDQPLTLLDAFPFVMTEESQQEKGVMINVNKVMYSVADESGEVHNVMQNLNASRERFIKLYAQVKAANIVARSNKQLSLTNVVFREVGNARFGNKPIILSFTADSREAWSDNEAKAIGA